MRRLAIACALACATGSCSGSPTEPPWDGTVRVAGTLRDFRTDAPISGARVDFDGTTATTDGNGGYALTVESGERTVRVDGSPIAIVTLNNRTYRGDFLTRTASCVARYGLVADALTRFPVAGARVTVGGVSALTDQSGWFRADVSFSSDCVGFNTTFLTITHPDYKDASFVAGRGVCGVVRVDYLLTRR